MVNADTVQSIRNMPKIDLHRHLEGSLRLSTMVDIIEEEGLDLPADEDQLRPMVQITPSDPLTFENFLSKFGTLRQFYRNEQIIRRITSEAIEDAASDHIVYLELMFTPVALSRIGHFPMGDVMDWVVDEAGRAAERCNVEVCLTASVNRHESADLAEEVTELAVDRINKGVLALDLAGNEAEFPADPFREIFLSAKQAGLFTTVHAGEWNNAESVRYALEEMKVDRIGHGVRILEDPLVVRMAKERGTVFEVCPTSNIQSGVIASAAEHPLRGMLQLGLQVTLNTDDPRVSDIVLSDEQILAVESMGFSLESVKAMTMAAAQASFLQKKEKSELLASLQADLPGLG